LRRGDTAEAGARAARKDILERECVVVLPLHVRPG
jgi:hypothetical protein